MGDETDIGLDNPLPQHVSCRLAMTENRDTALFRPRNEQADCGSRPNTLLGDSGGSGSFSMIEMLEMLDNLANRQDDQMAQLRSILQESLAQLQEELSSKMEQQSQHLSQMLANFSVKAMARRRLLTPTMGSAEVSSLCDGGGDGKESLRSPSAEDLATGLIAYTPNLFLGNDVPERDHTKPMNFKRYSSMSPMKQRIAVRSSRGLPGSQDTPVRRLVKSQRFDNFSALLVITNAIFIGVQVEYMFRISNTPLWISVTDYAFCGAFVCELCLRLYADGRQVYFSGDDYAWNWFDFLIVSLSTVDALLSAITQGDQSPLGNISMLRTVRIIRVTRVLRIIRVMKFFKELRIMIAAICSTLKTATWALLLLLLTMYMFGIAITQVVAERVRDRKLLGMPLHDGALLKWFGSLPKTMFTLFCSISGGIDYEHAAKVLFDLPLSFAIYMFFILFASFCIMNVMTGIFCQNAVETFENDRENLIQCQLAEKTRFVNTLTAMFREWDTSGDGHCTREDFETHISDPRMQLLLRTLDIEARDAVHLFGMMDVDETGCLDVFDLEEFIHGCITLRGGAKAVHMERALVDNKLTMAKLNKIVKYLKDLCIKLDEVDDHMLASCLPDLGPGSVRTTGKSHRVAVKRAKHAETSTSSQEALTTLEPMQPVDARLQISIAEIQSSSQADRAVPNSTNIEINNIRPPSPTKPLVPTQGPIVFFAPGVIPDS